MLERFVAGIVVIGLLLWGASIIATPDAESTDAPGGSTDARILPGPKEPAARDARHDDEEHDDEDDDDGSSSIGR